MCIEIIKFFIGTMLAFTMSMNSNETIVITEQGNKTIEIFVQDRETGKLLGLRMIKRAELARFFFEQRVIGSKNGKSVVQY